MISSSHMASSSDSLILLQQIQNTLQSLQQENRQLVSAVETINARVNVLAGVKQVRDAAKDDHDGGNGSLAIASPILSGSNKDDSTALNLNSTPSSIKSAEKLPETTRMASTPTGSRSANSSRIILTTYPGQSGVDPIVMNWGHRDPAQRGPVVVSRSHSTVRRRNGWLDSYSCSDFHL